jgi:superfamily II DNA/RNA helicase
MPALGPAASLAADATFASLGVPAPLVTVLENGGITAPFPIQAATLPDALAGLDILGRAQTGSGKTLGFSLPMVARLAGGSTAAGRPRGLILVPTRELATQVELVLLPLARALGLRVATIYGGVSYRPQINALQRATDILVACPGRLADLIGQGECDLSDVEITVIDEADQMADLGFLPIVRRLLEATAADGQRMLFSATLDSAIDVLARRFLHNPAQHSVDEHSSPAEIEHHVLTIDHKQRIEVLAALAGGAKRSLVFTRTKHGAQRLAKQLTTVGIPAAELHGNLAQGARARNLAAFSTGVAKVMVATDIAARGIHVDGIELVIHADPPAEHKAYVHRSGRTARGGADGIVVTMQTAGQSREVRKLMREAGVTPTVTAAAPDSEVLRELSGKPAERVYLDKPVTDLVKQPGRRGPRDDRPGRRSRGGFGDGHGGRSDRPRADRPRRRDDRRDERTARGDRTFADRTGTDRGGRDDRGGRFERQDGRDRQLGGDRQWSGDRRPAGNGRSWDGNDRSWGNGDRRAARPAGPAGRANGGAVRRPSGEASRRGDSAGRSGPAGRRDWGGNHRNPGQGRHF